jgi:hypothetical protein
MAGHLNKSRLNGKQRAFLAAYSKTGNISVAAKSASVGRRSHRDWMASELYSTAFAEADEDAIELLEGEALRRAVQGTERTVYYQGRECGRMREYSDNLLMFLLKGRKPEKYRDNVQVQHTGEINLIIERLNEGRKRVALQRIA